MAFSPDASDVYRTHVTKFVPSSGYNEPDLAEIRTLLAAYEAVMNAFTTNGGLIYQTMAAMNAAATTFSEPRSAWQFEAGSEGVYVLNPTTDSWTKVGRLPYDFVIGTDIGAGTANAIQITTDIPVADGMIVAFSPFEATTSSPVTVAINGGAALTLKTNRGSNASALTAGMEIWGRVRSSDNTLRLLNDQDVAALVAQAEAAKDAAVAAAASVDTRSVADRTALKTLGTVTTAVAYLREAGREGFFKWTLGDFSADVTADPEEGIHVKADAVAASTGVWKRVYDGLIFSTWFGVSQTGSAAANKTAFQAALNYVAQQTNVERRTLHTPAGNYSIEGTITSPQSALQVCLTGDGRFATVFLHTGPANVLFHIKGEGSYSQGFAIQRSGGPVAGDGTRAFLIKKDYGTIDPDTGEMPKTDADFGMTQMRITGYDIGVEFWGRGLQTGDTDFGACNWSYDVYWPNVGDYTEGSQPVQKDATGFRYFHLHGIRAHSNLSGLMRNTGENAAKINGINIENISMDIGRTLFEGVLRQGVISDFVITQTPVSAFKLKAGSEDFRIETGTIQGDTDALRVPPYFIEMSGNMSSGHIHGLTLRNCTSHGIYHDGTDGAGGASGTGVATDMVISSIDFVEPCTTIVGANPIRFNGPNHTVDISDITIDVAVALPGILRGTSSSAVLRMSRTKSLRAFTPPIASGSLGARMDVDRYTAGDAGGNYEEFRSHNGTLNGRIIQGPSAIWLVANDASNIWLGWGAGSPEGAQTAGVGSVYWDITNGVQYNKKTGTGNTGWKLVTQAA